MFMVIYLLLKLLLLLNFSNCNVANNTPIKIIEITIVSVAIVKF